MIIGYETTAVILVLFLGIVFLIYYNRQELKDVLKNSVSKYSLLALLLILIFFLSFELLFVHPVEQLYFDENIYQGIALNVLKHGNALWCQIGTGYLDRCYANALYHDPVGWTVFIAMAFGLFGIGTATAFNLELLVGALSVVGIFLLASVLLNHKEIAVLATAVFVSQPELLIWSRTQADIDLPFMMLSIFAFFFFVVFAKRRSKKSLLLFIFSMLLASYMRIEGILLIPLFMLLLFLFSDEGVRHSSELPRPYGWGFSFHQEILASSSGKYRHILLPSVSPTFHRESPFGQTSYTRNLYKPFARSRSHPLSYERGLLTSGVKKTAIELKNTVNSPFLLSIILLTLLLFFPEIHYFAIEAANPSYGQPAGVSILSFANFKENIYANTMYVLGLIQNFYPEVDFATLGPLALIGVGLLLFVREYKNRFSIASILGLWPLLYFLFYTSFYAGGVTYGVDVRFMLQILPGLSILAGFALFEIAQLPGMFIRRLKNKYTTYTIIVALFVLLAVFPFVKISSLITLTPNNMPQQTVIYPAMAAFYANYEKVPTNCLVFSSTPDIWYEMGRSAAQITYFDTSLNESMKSVLSNYSCFVFDYGYWCQVPPEHNGVCNVAINEYKTKILATTYIPNSMYNSNVTYYELLNYKP